MKETIKIETIKSIDINFPQKESLEIIEDLEIYFEFCELNKSLVEPNNPTKWLLKYLKKLNKE